MASQKIPQTYTPLVSLAADAEDGAITYGAAVGLSLNTAAKITPDLEDLTGHAGTPGNPADPAIPGKQALYIAAKSDKPAKAAALRTVTSNVRGYCATAIDVLRPHLGRSWNSAWQTAGFVNGSLGIPDDPLPLLDQLRAYFTAHPAHENAPLGVTAAACETWKTTLGDARKAANDSLSNLGAAKTARDAAQETLYQRMSGLLAELGQLLGDDDPRWYNFGFDRPADGEQPGLVTDIVLTAGGPGMVFADWDDARRADRYRARKQIVGTDAEPVEVANAVTESEYTFTGLPSGATVKISIVPVNKAGDGPESDPVQIVVP